MNSCVPSGENWIVQTLALRSGWTSEAIRFGAVGSDFAPAFGGRTGIEWVVGATFAPFQASNDRVTVAVPSPAASATRTGPSKLTVQHRSLISYFSLNGEAPGLAGWKVISATGFASLGTVSS